MHNYCALSGSAYPGGSLSANEKYDRTPVIEDGGTAAEAELYLKNDQMKLCGNTECGNLGLSDAQTVTYDRLRIKIYSPTCLQPVQKIGSRYFSD